MKKMKKLIAIFGLAALVFAGCSNPVENSVEPIISETRYLQQSDDHGTYSPEALPTFLYAEKEIDGHIGGQITLLGIYKNYYGDEVTVTAKLTIPKDAYTGIKLISMRTDDYSPAMEFQPGGNFVKPLKLDLKFVGMKLERYNLSNGKTDFFYIADDGTRTVIKNDGLSVNLAEKKAEVKGAELMHFSRYGFIRKFSQESSSSSSL